ncbi:MAG TPA: ABC transporter permease subunit [Burkholderiaceae bacterium]|nr:ABC transporter permease subunit [Burkholderiaceae bacterium]
MIRTPLGLVVHTGDFKLDHTPVMDQHTDLIRLAQVGAEGCLLLLADSTYAEQEGYTPSEQLVGEALRTILVNAPGRVIVATFASLFAAVFAAYAIERLRFRGAKGTGLAIFLAYLIPPSILFIPLAFVLQGLGLFNTRWALIFTYPTFLIPFCTWLLMGYFRSIPFELEECALIDGASRWQILGKIILPLAVPGLISAGIFAFTLSWNEFIYALTFVSDSEIKTVPVAVVTELVEGDVYHWGPLMAGALLGSLPVAVFYSFFVEYYVAGMTGAVKE